MTGVRTCDGSCHTVEQLPFPRGSVTHSTVPPCGDSIGLLRFFSPSAFTQCTLYFRVLSDLIQAGVFVAVGVHACVCAHVCEAVVES